jgi:UDP-N-acetyl-D-mannosaminuronate dehydrogenase
MHFSKHVARIPSSSRFLTTDAQRLKDIKTIGVIGAGQMGVGIAYVAAASGRQVLLLDSNETQVKKGMEFIGSSIQETNIVEICC